MAKDALLSALLWTQLLELSSTQARSMQAAASFKSECKGASEPPTAAQTELWRDWGRARPGGRAVQRAPGKPGCAAVASHSLPSTAPGTEQVLGR